MSIFARKAWRDLRVRPTRSLLTLAGIVIGVAGVVAIVLAGRSLTRAQRQSYQNQTQADVTVWVWNADESLIRALEALPGVATAERRAVTYSKWRSGGRWLDIELQGVERFEDIRVNQTELLEGRFPGRGEIALEVSAQDLAEVSLGQTIEIRGPDGSVETLTVSGFTRTPYYPSAGLMRLTVGYVPASTVRPYLGTRGDNRLLLRLSDFRQREEYRTQIESLLDRRRVPRGALTVRDPDAYTGHRELETLLQLMTALSALALVISTFLVTNTLAAIVAEEIREIGILKSMGAIRRHILRIYLWSGLVYALVGTPLGIFLGSLGGWQLLRYLGHLFNVDVGSFRADPLAIGLGLLIGLGVTVPATLFPAWRGSRITVREALQGYGIRSEGGQSPLARLHLSPLWAFSLRNLARRPGRSITTVLVVTVAVAAFLSARITQASLSYSIDTLFGVYAADAWVWFDQPVGAGFTAELRTVAGVEEAEVWEIGSCIVGGEQVRLWGLPAETTLYRRDIAAGRWYSPGEYQAVVLSLDLAERQGHRVGDLVEVEIAGRLRQFLVVGIVRDEAIFGLGDAPIGKVFAPINVVLQMSGRQDQVGNFALGLEQHDPDGVDAILGQVERKFRALRPGTEPAYAGYEQAADGTRIVAGLLYAVVVIVAVVGTVGILNTQALNVLERRREIGVLRSLGGLRGHLLRFFLTEGLALGSLGFLVGLPAGWALARLLIGIISAALITLRFTVPPADIGLGLGFALLLSILAGLFPALAAARLRVAEVLRYD